jgi:CelD/BcsL family acetyltransferase involved in cellulose biosynthesis
MPLNANSVPGIAALAARGQAGGRGLVRRATAADTRVGDRDPRICIWHVLTDREGLAELTPEWSRLAAGSDTSLFVTPEWVSTWYRHIAPAVEPRLVTLRDDLGRLTAVWPLGVRTVGSGVTARRVLEPMGGIVASGDG